MQLVRFAALSAVVLVLAAAPARANQTGPLTWSVPEGYRVTRTWDAGADLAGPSGVTIAIRVGLQGAAALDVGRAAIPADANQELKEMAIQVCGQTGHLVVRRNANRIHASAACVPAAGQAIAITLSAPPASYQEGCVTWGALVDGGSVSVQQPGRQARPGQGPGDHRTDDAPVRQRPAAQPRQPARHWVELRNGASWGTATLYFDGEAHSLDADEGQRIEVSAGDHTFKWQNEDGSWGEGTFAVPRYSRFTGSCPRPAEPAPAPEASGPEWSEADYQEGAKWYVNLICFSVYVVRTMDTWNFPEETYHAPAMIDPIIAELRARPDLREFAAQIPHFWARIDALWTSGTAEERYALRREGASFILKNSPGTYTIPGPDGEAGDGIDRLLRQQAREAAQLRAQRRQDQTSRTIASRSVNSWIFNQTSNAMTFTPSSW
jgi:hypothetical protein